MLRYVRLTHGWTRFGSFLTSLAVIFNSTIAIGHDFASAPVVMQVNEGIRLVPTDVNNFGIVVGINVFDEEDILPDAFLWSRKRGYVRLPTIRAGFARAEAINDCGEIVGSEDDTAFDGVRGVRWSIDGEVEDLGSFFPRDINERGDMVGRSESGNALLWTASGGFLDLGTLGGNFSFARALNNHREVVGFSSTASSSATHAFLWTRHTGMIDLGTLGGATSDANAINDNGTVVGWSETAEGSVHPFKWTRRRGMVDLGTLDGDTGIGRAVDVNAGGLVVGTSSSDVEPTRATIWVHSSAILELPQHFGVRSGASAVNDRGLITGTVDNFGVVWRLRESLKN